MKAPPIFDIHLDESAFDPDAVNVARRLQQAGFPTYLVGGCVRDLLLGRRPKDFDIATAARPRQIRRLFRNCRIIGRRFRLAHVYAGGKILEVATFRGKGAAGVVDTVDPEEVIERSNVFGTPEQDARSRDFTINALFYDPIQGHLIDYVGGHRDLRDRVLRTVGPASVRFEEDPVRILRAVRFLSRLPHFRPHPEVAEAMRARAGDIRGCAPPRVLEEVLRIAEQGTARRAFGLMIEYGVLGELLPELAAYVAGERGDPAPAAAQALDRATQWLDWMVRAHGGVSREFAAMAVAHPYIWAGVRDLGPKVTWGLEAEALLRKAYAPLVVPGRFRLRVRFVYDTLQRFVQSAHRPKRRRALVRREQFPEALAMLRLHSRVYEGHGADAYEEWAELAAEEGIARAPVLRGPRMPILPERRGGQGPRRRPRPRRGRRRSARVR